MDGAVAVISPYTAYQGTGACGTCCAFSCLIVVVYLGCDVEVGYTEILTYHTEQAKVSGGTIELAADGMSIAVEVGAERAFIVVPAAFAGTQTNGCPGAGLDAQVGRQFEVFAAVAVALFADLLDKQLQVAGRGNEIRGGLRTAAAEAGGGLCRVVEDADVGIVGQACQDEGLRAVAYAGPSS